MRLAIVITSSYDRVKLPTLPSAVIDGELLGDRLAERDAGFVVEYVGSVRKLTARLERLLTTTGKVPDSVLVFFSGHVAPRDDRLALLVPSADGTRLRRLRAERLGRLLSGIDNAAVVLDLVHPPMPEDALASVAVLERVRAEIGQQEHGLHLISAARPADAQHPTGSSMFARLLLLGVERSALAEGGEVSLARVYQELRKEADRVGQPNALAYFSGQKPFLLTRHGADALTAQDIVIEESVPVSSPVSSAPRSKPPPKPRRRSSGSLRAQAPPKRRPSGQLRAPPAADAAPASVDPPSEPLDTPPLSEHADASDPLAALSRAAENRSVKPKPATADEMVEGGFDQLALDEYASAIDHFKRALFMLPSSRKQERGRIHLGLGRAKLALGREPEAANHFDKALTLDSGLHEAFDEVREILLKQKDYTTLERLLKQRLDDSEPRQRASAWAGLAQLWRQQGELRRAEEILRRALSDAPDAPELLAELAELQLELGRHRACVESLERLIELLPTTGAQAMAALQAARVTLEFLPDRAKALAFARRALELDPTRLDALELLAVELGGERKFRQLAEIYQAVAVATNDQELAFDLNKKLGLIYRDELSDVEAARIAFANALKTHPADHQTRMLLADVYEKAQQWDELATLLKQAIYYEPLNASLSRRLLGCAERLGDHDAAWRAAVALESLEDADINESLLAGQHRPEGLLEFNAAIDASTWQRLTHPAGGAARDVLATVARSAVAVRSRQLKSKGKLPDLSDHEVVDTQSGTTMLGRSLAWTSRVLGIEEPTLYLAKTHASTLHAVPANAPSVVAGRGLARDRSLHELVGTWARHLGTARAGLELQSVFPTIRELAPLLLAALWLGGAEDVEAEGRVADLADELEEDLTPDESEALQAAVGRFPIERAKAELEEFVVSCAHTGARVALLTTSDLELVLSLLPQDADAVRADVIWFSLSDVYSQLRTELGIAVSDA